MPASVNAAIASIGKFASSCTIRPLPEADAQPLLSSRTMHQRSPGQVRLESLAFQFPVSRVPSPLTTGL